MAARTFESSASAGGMEGGLVSTKNRKWEATAFDDPALLRVIRNKKGEIVAFGRTRLGTLRRKCSMNRIVGWG